MSICNLRMFTIFIDISVSLFGMSHNDVYRLHVISLLLLL